MVSNDSKFSHISVSSDDVDEMVIHAGVRTSVPSASSSVDDGSHHETVDASPHSLDNPESVDQGEGNPSEESQADLQLEPMSLTQKIVIVLALLGVTAIVVYYILFMR